MIEPAQPAALQRSIATARRLIGNARSDNTRRSYETGWRQFVAHSEALGQETLPAHPALVATFLGGLRDHGATAATLRSRAAAIRFFHRQAGFVSPTEHRVVRDLLEGARREDAGRDHGRATILAEQLEAALEKLPPPSTPIAIRDRALGLLTYCAARRRSSTAALNIEDLDFSRPGFLIVTSRRGKTDQGGEGEFVAIPRLETGPCAVAAVEAWLEILGEKKGPLFRSFTPQGELKRDSRIDGRVVAEVTKRIFRRAGASKGEVARIAAHSLRRGFATSADIAGATTSQILAVGGWKDPRSLRRYVRRELLADPVLPKIFR